MMCCPPYPNPSLTNQMTDLRNQTISKNVIEYADLLRRFEQLNVTEVAIIMVYF